MIRASAEKVPSEIRKVTEVVDVETEALEVVNEMADEDLMVKETGIKEVVIKETEIKEVAVKETEIKEVELKEIVIKELVIKEMEIKEVAVIEMLISEVAEEKADIFSKEQMELKVDPAQIIEMVRIQEDLVAQDDQSLEGSPLLQADSSQQYASGIKKCQM